MIESLLLTATRVFTFEQQRVLTNASGFFFERDARLFLVTSRQLLIVGFPLGFHDTLHHMPVVRHAVVASAFGLRFQGQGYFLTDARTHRGTSGAPVVMRALKLEPAQDEMPWTLLGVHSAVFDVGTRDVNLDEALGLNCAWYADILLTLTAG